MRGRFIVLEGADGSGKETQALLLVHHLERLNTPVLYFDFPQYEGFYGQIVAKYLRGEFGLITETSPYLVSVIYALDRSTVREKIQSFLDSGGTVVSNRYVPSNVAHQAANIQEEAKRNEFVDWVQKLEYDQLKLPHEDDVIYLDLPWELGMKRSEEKLKKDGRHSYLVGKADIHEINPEHRRISAKIYLQLSKNFEHWHLLNCVDDKGEQLSVDQIHKEILSILHL